VRRIADREESRPMPASEPVELHREEVKVGDLVELAEIEIRWRGCRDFLADRFNSARLIVRGGALRNEEGALPIVAAIDQHEQPAALDIAAKAAFAAFLGDSEPEDVHRGAQILNGKQAAGERRPPIGGDGDAGP
jgi:hypothetical protein